jgi:hypothetical protein
LLLVSMISRRIRRNQRPPSMAANSLLMSHFFIVLGSLPLHLPQRAPWQLREKHPLRVPFTPTSGIDRGKYRYP